MLKSGVSTQAVLTLLGVTTQNLAFACAGVAD